jgi:hypothetical protein
VGVSEGPPELGNVLSSWFQSKVRTGKLAGTMGYITTWGLLALW